MPKNAIYPLEQANTGIYGHRIKMKNEVYHFAPEAPSGGRR
jgi:hypothetical protein